MTPASAVNMPVVSPAVPFPLARAARLRYDLSEPRFTDILIAREAAAKINATRDLEAEPARAVQAGVLSAASLLDEIYAHLIAQYVAQVEPRALLDAPPFIEERLGSLPTRQLFDALHTDFEAPLTRPEAVEYALRLRLVNTNPALEVIQELFDDNTLPQPIYAEAHSALYDYFDALPPIGPRGKRLLDLLFDPFRTQPDSVEEQLRLLLAKGGEFVAPFVSRLLFQLDVLSEENKPVFYGPGPALIPEYSRAVGAEEYEAFSSDKAWMPEVVLLAKNSYVWLDQLSKKFGRHIYRLDQVPDEELDEMAARGFSGLWLIGLWQRSKASQTIKQLCGNPDAVASAYSLHSYDIAWELGGLEALDDLRVRAAQRGVRLASDMVPNHMAIDSQWVMEHPDWFLSLPQSPYPQYRFEGPDVSNDPRTGIYLENHYYSKTDAAVVFQRVDRESGDVRYVYHGNDGTTMPWNDTAQLNYLLPEVREALIQTILHVARHFPIIRFDAAMTLAKRHYHRLWFPTPGEGGAIPTRAGQGLTPDEFDQLFPQEFWREVVDRVAQEVPDTLLLAEAFWLMEGYFVRTLGMHRVYNSAFMNMMRDEKNAEYRQVMKNTLEFDPDILGRYVNFINNPDEKTSVEQFGKSDKYFGVCTLLATLPGLPMFGHGQVEGYEEKYGMEYPRAYWDEQPDKGLIAHHEQVIFPLLHRRALFAGSEHFTLYDFWTNDGAVNEDVFAYSNRHGEDRALVVYHNRHAPTAGWINNSVGYAQKAADGSRDIVQRALNVALGLSGGEKAWAIFRDNTTGLEYLHRSRDLMAQGLFVELSAYGYHVFLDWREVQDAAGLYEKLAVRLKGGGVPSVEIALREMVLEPLRGAFMPLVEDEMWRDLLTPTPVLEDEIPTLLVTGIPANNVALEDGPVNGSQSAPTTKLESEFAPTPVAVSLAPPVIEVAPKQQVEITPAMLDAFEKKLRAFGSETREFFDLHGDADAFAQKTRARMEKVLPVLQQAPDVKKSEDETDLTADSALPSALWGWALLSQIGLLGLPTEGEKTINDVEARSRAWIDEWLLAPLVEEALSGFGVATEVGERAVKLAKLLTAHVCSTEQTPFDLLQSLISDDDARLQMRINRFEGVTWFNKEGFDTMLDWLQFAADLERHTLPVAQLKSMAAESGYRVVKLLELAHPTMIVPADESKPIAAPNGKAVVVEAGVKS